MSHSSIAEVLSQMTSAFSRLHVESVESAVEILYKTQYAGGTIYVFGNGGSASTASHLAVDMSRRLMTDTGRRIRVIALNDNVPWCTAVANDNSYDEVFAEQLRIFLQPNDLVVGISASGNSPNMIKAFDVAKSMGVPRLALVGFDGGHMSRMATGRIWVDSDDYGVIETAHVGVTHLLVDGLVQRCLAMENVSPIFSKSRSQVSGHGAVTRAVAT
ncbi:MAG: D-sedoheptulose-7-phosphate isomerase [Phycisphaerae bacterium]